MVQELEKENRSVEALPHRNRLNLSIVRKKEGKGLRNFLAIRKK